MIRTTRFAVASLVLLVALAAFAAGVLVAKPYPSLDSGNSASSTSSASKPDWTVAQCSLWADSANPVLPPYTITDACAYQDSTGNWQISRP